MKKGFKRSMLIVVAVVAMFVSNAFVLTGCAAADFRIGINQFMPHPSLDEARIGFTTKLTELLGEVGKTVRFDYRNAGGDDSTNASINTTFANRNVCMIFALATPSATNARDAARARNIPVVYGAITAPEDPETALYGVGAEHVTGVSDLLDMYVQLEFIQRLLGDEPLTHVAYLYTSGERNSLIQGNHLVAAAARRGGVGITRFQIPDISALPLRITEITGNSAIQAIFIGTDNLLAANMMQVANLNRLATRSLPVITGATSMAEEGGVASLGVNYTDVGREAAKIAFRILIDGETPGDIRPVYFDAELLDLLINKSIAYDIGFTIPQAIIDEATATGTVIPI